MKKTLTLIICLLSFYLAKGQTTLTDSVITETGAIKLFIPAKASEKITLSTAEAKSNYRELKALKREYKNRKDDINASIAIIDKKIEVYEAIFIALGIPF